MKRNILYCITFIGFLLSCSEPEEQNPIVRVSKNSPTCVYQSYDKVGTEWRHRYYFFDLNHEETKDKQYFVAEFTSSLYDSMIVVVAPRSIDSLGSNFPAEIMEYPGYGGIGFWSNASYLVRYTPDRKAFYKDFAPTNPNEPRYFMNDPGISGTMAGKWPNAYLFGMRIPDGGTGDHRKVELYFHFKYGMCVASQYFYAGGDETELGVPLDNNGLLTLHTIDDVFPHVAGVYDWETVSSVVVAGGAFPTYIFFDFETWRSFKWTEGRTDVIGNRTYRTITYFGNVDLNNMIKWPEGWGKP